MQNFIKISIRLFLIFTIFRFLNSFALLINNTIAVVTQDPMFGYYIDIKIFLPFIISSIVYFTIVILLWKKSEVISKKIVGDNDIENITISLDYNKILSFGIIILGIFLLIFPIPRIFSYAANFVVARSRFVDDTFIREMRIRDVIEIIGIGLKMMAGYLIIKYNDKVIKIIMEMNKNE